MFLVDGIFVGNPLFCRIVYGLAGEILQARFFGAPGMGNDLAVKVRYRLGSRNC